MDKAHRVPANGSAYELLAAWRILLHVSLQVKCARRLWANGADRKYTCAVGVLRAFLCHHDPRLATAGTDVVKFVNYIRHSAIGLH
jgi:hypothetical protein